MIKVKLEEVGVRWVVVGCGREIVAAVVRGGVTT